MCIQKCTTIFFLFGTTYNVSRRIYLRVDKIYFHINLTCCGKSSAPKSSIFFVCLAGVTSFADCKNIIYDINMSININVSRPLLFLF